jgi:hypothetical protein
MREQPLSIPIRSFNVLGKPPEACGRIGGKLRSKYKEDKIGALQTPVPTTIAI